MAYTYAKKFEPKVQESFKINSLTDRAINHDYNFNGVKSITVFSVDTSKMQNYNDGQSVPGNSRYGTIENLGNTTQDFLLNVDRSFTFAIDRMQDKNALGILNPGKALQRQIEQRIIPEIDRYRLAKIVNDKNHIDKNETITKANAYTSFLDAIGTMLDKGVPMAGTFAYISTNFYKQIRLDDSFIKASDMAQEMRLKGVVGMVEGIPLIHVPGSYFPTEAMGSGADLDAGGDNTGFGSQLTNLTSLLASGKKVEFMLVNKAAVLGAEKLVDYKIHDNPPGINGWLVEGRMVYDCFILDKKKDMIYIHTTTP